MAIESTETKTVKRVLRTRQIIIDTPVNGAYRFAAIRHDLEQDPTTQAVESEVQDGEVVRMVASVAAETVTLQSGRVIAVAEIAEALKLFGDRWYQEDRGL